VINGSARAVGGLAGVVRLVQTGTCTGMRW
jgi:hypothetical protein